MISAEKGGPCDLCCRSPAGLFPSSISPVSLEDVPLLQHTEHSNLAGDGRGWGVAASCCARLSSSAKTDGQMLGLATGALSWGCTHFSALEVLAQPCLLLCFASPVAQPFRLPLGTSKGQTQQNRAGIGICLAAGAQREELSPSAQK